MTLRTKPVEPEHIDEFYRRVHPFGLWRSIRDRVLASGRPISSSLRPGLIVVNLPLGIIATYALYMAPVYLMGKWFTEMAVCLGVFAACCVALYFTWFKTLPEK